MSEFLLSLISLTFLTQMLAITVPYALAAMGGVVSERSGVVNIALEGMLLMGAFGAGVGAYDSGGNASVALLYGVGAGLVTSSLYAFAVVTFHSNQIVSGVAINILAYGLTPYLLKTFYNSSSNSPGFEGFGSNVFGLATFWLIVGIVVVVQLVVSRTSWGLRVRAVGDHPEAAHTLGVSVTKVRWQAVLASGALAGLGGAWLALSQSSFVAGMSAGRGYTALAAVIMSSWRPGWACAASLMFGFAEAALNNMQTYDLGIPNEIAQTFPHVLTMITLVGYIGRSRAPKSLGQPFRAN